MSDNRVFQRRQFLNTEQHGGIALIDATVYAFSHDSVSATFSVGDCNRVVELDFAAYSPEASANARQKIIKFRRAVLAFEAALVAQLDELDRTAKE